MEPLNTYDKSRQARKITNIAFFVTASLFVTTVPVEANSFLEEGKEGIINYVKNIEYGSIQGNVSIIKQNGNNNYASVVQLRSDSENYQLANFARIYQDGNNNQASISQRNGDNIGIIKQFGDNHNADITQEGYEFRAESESQAEINQFGFGGNIKLSILGSGLRSIRIEQQNHSSSALPVTIHTY